MSCQAVKNGEVKRKGEPTLEFYDKQGKPVYFCYGYIDLRNDELIDTCANCRKNVRWEDEYERN